MYFITVHIIVVYSVLSQTETQYDRFRCDTFEAAYFSNHTLLNIAHENMSVNVYSHPRSVRVCVHLYTRFISHSVALTRNYSFGIECFRPACLTYWLTVYIVVHRIHTLAHTPTQPKNVDSFSIVVFGFAYCLCGSVEWIHHPFGVIRNPRKTCRCLSYFR